jgi:hypothetical protein
MNPKLNKDSTASNLSIPQQQLRDFFILTANYANHSAPVLVTFAANWLCARMNDSSNKYFTLMGLLLLSLAGFVALLVGIFYLLKLFSVTMFYIPGSAWLFNLFIVSAPYLILFAAYYLVYNRIRTSKPHPAKTAASIILTAGSLFCVAGLTISLLEFFKVNTVLIRWYNPVSKYSFAGHLLLMLLATGLLATSEPKEKSWLDRQR